MAPGPKTLAPGSSVLLGAVDVAGWVPLPTSHRAEDEGGPLEFHSSLEVVVGASAIPQFSPLSIQRVEFPARNAQQTLGTGEGDFGDPSRVRFTLSCVLTGFVPSGCYSPAHPHSTPSRSIRASLRPLEILPTESEIWLRDRPGLVQVPTGFECCSEATPQPRGGILAPDFMSLSDSNKEIQN